MLRQGLRWVVRWELLFVALLAPLLLFPGSTSGLAMVGVPLLWGLRWLDQRRFIRRTPLDWSIFLLLLMVLFSSMSTFDPDLSLPKVTGLVLGVATYYGLAARLERPRDIWLGVAFVVAVGCGVACISLLGTNWFQKLPVLGPLSMRLPVAIRGLPGSPPDGFHPNQVAGALVWLLPLLLAIFWSYRSRPLPLLPPVWRRPARVVFLLAMLLIGGTMLLTQSRSGYIGLFCGLVALVVLPHRRLLHAILIVATLSSAIALAVGPQVLEAYSRIETLQSSQALSTDTLDGRFELWSRVVFAIRDFPLTGVGIGAFRRVQPVLYPLSSTAPDSDLGHAHNHLLNAALDLGLPGLVAYLALWLGVAAMARQALRDTANEGLYTIALGLSGGMVASFTYSMTDMIALGAKPGLLMWLVFGLIFCLYEASRGGNAPASAQVATPGLQVSAGQTL